MEQEEHRIWDELSQCWEYTRYGLLHRDDDKPARVCKNGHRSWHKGGHLYREKGPSIIDKCGEKYNVNTDVERKTFCADRTDMGYDGIVVQVACYDYENLEQIHKYCKCGGEPISEVEASEIKIGSLSDIVQQIGERRNANRD